jgi:hypothetical protein
MTLQVGKFKIRNHFGLQAKVTSQVHWTQGDPVGSAQETEQRLPIGVELGGADAGHLA